MKGVDVSCYQGKIDWHRVKDAGVEFALIKIIRSNGSADEQFEANWNGCTEVGVPIKGVYNYSYATTVERAKADAQTVLRILNGRRTKVYLDVEDTCQKNLGSTLIDIINAYKEIIEASGNSFGVYTGLSFYNTYLKPYIGQVDYNFWIARYPTMNPMSLTDNAPGDKKPSITNTVEGWQYSSKGQIPGINGSVDLNQWYL